MYLLIPMCQTSAERFPFTLDQDFSGLAPGNMLGFAGVGVGCLFLLFIFSVFERNKDLFISHCPLTTL